MKKKIQEPPLRIIDGENLRKEWEGVSEYLKIKELLKPPFFYVVDGRMKRTIKLADKIRIDIWIDDDNVPDKELCEFFTAAINEKYVRDYIEPFQADPPVPPPDDWRLEE